MIAQSQGEMRRNVVYGYRAAIVLLAVLGFFAGDVSAQAHESVPVTKKQPERVGWLDYWRQATVSFGAIERDQYGQQYYKAIGTGIVFTTNPKSGYIITAKHVVYDPARNYHPSEIRVRFPWQESESVYKQYGTVVILRDASGADLWRALDDGSDIAAIPLAPSMNGQPAAAAGSVAQSEEVFEGESIITLGYPGIVGREYLIRAISRGGIIAWLNPQNPHDSRFLIDCNVYPGNSGGPVILVPGGFDKFGNFNIGGRPALLGIVVEAPGQSQEVSLNVPGVRTPLILHQEIPVGGTGVVEPASKVSKLLQSLEAKAP